MLAHGGDTLSPSLMSGVDQGAHILNLTNMLKPDIFVPGNHEFDFGKAVFLKRMAEAKFPLFGANLQTADGKLVPGFKDRDIVTIDGIRVGFTGAAHDNTPRLSNSGDLKFRPTVETMKATFGDLPISLKFLYEGEEEIGSPSLKPFCEQNRERLAANLTYYSDSHIHESGRPILPFAMVTSRFIRLNNWDRTTINLPFGQGAVVGIDAIVVPADADGETMEALRLQLEEYLNESTRRAYAKVGRPEAA